MSLLNVWREKMRKIFLSCVIITLLFGGKIRTEGAPILYDCSNEIVFYKDEIKYQYRLYNGVLQYRRWNVTQNCWVDPYWIDC